MSIARISHYRQVRPMLLNRSDREDDNRIRSREGTEFLGLEPGPVDFGHGSFHAQHLCLGPPANWT